MFVDTEYEIILIKGVIEQTSYNDQWRTSRRGGSRY